MISAMRITRLNQQARWWAFLPLVLAIPLLWPGIPPLIDLLGHIGRYRIQLEPDNPLLQQFFSVDWRLLPNLGVDLLVMLLAPLVGLEPAVKIVVTLIPVLTGTGFLLIAREIHGRVPPTTLFALPLTYAWPLQNGFVNYCLSMGVAMLAFGIWLRLGRLGQQQRRGWLFLIISPMLWITHLYGWLVLGLLVGAFELVRQRQAGTAWLSTFFRTFLLCVPLTLPFLFSMIWGEEGVGATGEWFSVKMWVTWIVTVLRDRWQWLDLASAGLMYALAVSPIFFRRSIMIEWTLAVPAAALWLTALGLPNMLAGSYFAGVRLFPYALALTIIALRPSLPAKFMRWFMIAGLLFVGVRLISQTASYVIADAQARSNLKALNHIKRGSRIATLVGQRCGNWPASRHLHLPEMATVRLDAFTNGHWDMAGAQIIDVTYMAGGPFTSDPSQFVDVSGCSDRIDRLATNFKRVPLDAFDYLWVVEVPAAEWPKDTRLQRIWNNDGSVLYRILPVVAPTQSRP
jgi:hypothetical protein